LVNDFVENTEVENESQKSVEINTAWETLNSEEIV
jgi:hypothetical protein